MENMDKKEGMCGCGMGSGCGCCGGRHYHLHHTLRAVLKIVIVILIFWCGYKLGFMTGQLRSEYGRVNLMQEHAGGWINDGQYGGQMQGFSGGIAPAPVTTTPAK